MALNDCFGLCPCFCAQSQVILLVGMLQVPGGTQHAAITIVQRA